MSKFCLSVFFMNSYNLTLDYNLNFPRNLIFLSSSHPRTSLLASVVYFFPANISAVVAVQERRTRAARLGGGTVPVLTFEMNLR